MTSKNVDVDPVFGLMFSSGTFGVMSVLNMFLFIEIIVEVLKKDVVSVIVLSLVFIVVCFIIRVFYKTTNYYYIELRKKVNKK